MYDVVFIGKQIESPKLNTTEIAPEQLMSCRGEIGNFNLSYNPEGNDEPEKITTSTVVINIEADREKPLANVLSLTEDLSELNKVDSEESHIYIQDYPSLSPAIMSNEGLKKAIAAVEGIEDSQIYYFYRSMRFMADNDNLFEKARKLGVVFLKYEKGNLEVTGDLVKYEREDISLELQGKIIMAPEIKPPESLPRLARIFNLEQGPDGYLQAENVYLQPTLTGKRGVYILGGARGPTAYTDFGLEAEYTLNEIQSLLGDIQPVVSEERTVDDQKCVLCYTCYRVCPHGAVEQDEELDAMKILNLACEGCDACISHCPAKAISIVEEEEQLVDNELSDSDNNMDNVSDDIGSASSVSNFKVLMCENSADTALQKLDDHFDTEEFAIETIPCAGSIEKGDLYRYLRYPEDRLLVLGCFEESCQHLSGDRKAERIINEVKDTLAGLNLGQNRVTFERLAPRMEEDLKHILSRWKEGNL